MQPETLAHVESVESTLTHCVGLIDPNRDWCGACRQAEDNETDYPAAGHDKTCELWIVETARESLRALVVEVERLTAELESKNLGGDKVASELPSDQEARIQAMRNKAGDGSTDYIAEVWQSDLALLLAMQTEVADAIKILGEFNHMDGESLHDIATVAKTSHDFVVHERESLRAELEAVGVALKATREGIRLTEDALEVESAEVDKWRGRAVTQFQRRNRRGSHTAFHENENNRQQKLAQAVYRARATLGDAGGGALTATAAEGREGMVTVYDHENRYLGCMGIETWRAAITTTYETLRDRAGVGKGVVDYCDSVGVVTMTTGESGYLVPSAIIDSLAHALTGFDLPTSTTSDLGSLPAPSPSASPLEGHETGPDKQTGDDRFAVARKSGHNFAPGCTCSGGVDAYGHAWHDSSRCPLHSRFAREGSGGES